jgi:hypothetical protein
MITATEQSAASFAPPGEALRRILDEHHRRFSPFYQGYLSDHAPMAALALHGLGRGETEVLDWYDTYVQKLEPLERAPDRYLALLEGTRLELARYGRETLLKNTLPAYISGWARSAFHPLIRIAYGYHFQIDGEIAAGLAYLKWCGPDRRIERLAGSAASSRDPEEALIAFATVRPAATNVGPGRKFDVCLKAVIAHPAIADVARRYPDALPAFSRAALSIFDQTHDFFALHLVTGAHAFRTLYPFAGEFRDEIFSLGILAGYASVGAPVFSPFKAARQAVLTIAPELGKAVKTSDDHDIKLAYSAMNQAHYFADDAYAEVAQRYLSARSAD